MIHLLLGRQLRHRLARRLGLGGGVIALALGGLTYWHEMEGIEDALVNEAVSQAQQLAPTLPQRLERAGEGPAQKVLDAFVREHHKDRADHFIGAEIYGSDRQSLAESMPRETEKLTQSLDRSRHEFPAPGESWYRRHEVDGEVYLQVMTALDQPAGYFEGIYHVTAHRIRLAKEAGLRSTILVMLSVLAASGLLYPIILQMHRSLVAGARALLAANMGAIEMLGNAIAKRDSDTNSHNYRVTIYALKLAEAAGLGADGIRSLIKGAFLHDVGKLAIPDAILLKPAKLDDAEFEIMKTHVSHGLDVVRRFSWLDDAADVVGCHHEKFDGSGYLQGLSGEDIPINARIFAIADVFDALTSRRPYKEPMGVDQATSIMAAGRGSHFDPRLLDLFFAMAAELHAEYGISEEIGLDHALRRLGGPYFEKLLPG
jgi:HD-GYP domain-containing protein (c-di-GMP phosphodiesterase class II)